MEQAVVVQLSDADSADRVRRGAALKPASSITGEEARLSQHDEERDRRDGNNFVFSKYPMLRKWQREGLSSVVRVRPADSLDCPQPLDRLHLWQIIIQIIFVIEWYFFLFNPIALELSSSCQMHMRSVVYGGTDGIITIFAVVAGVSGAALPSSVLLVLGVATLFADAVSMSVSDYMSSSAESQVADRARREKGLEWDLRPNVIAHQLQLYFQAKGFAQLEATELAAKIAQNREASVDILIAAADLHEDESTPTSSAIFTFLAFVLFGMVPLLADIILSWMEGNKSAPSFLTTSLITALTLAALGAMKSILTRNSPFRGALQMVIVGGFASFLSYLIAYWMSNNGQPDLVLLPAVEEHS